MNSKLTLTISEAAETLGIGKSHLYRLLGTGELPSIKLGKRRLITRAALRKFIGLPAEEAFPPPGPGGSTKAEVETGLPIFAMPPGSEATYVLTIRRVDPLR